MRALDRNAECEMRNERNRPVVAVLLCLMLSAVAAFAWGYDKRGPDGDPKRSYGSIDVILYQTGW